MSGLDNAAALEGFSILSKLFCAQGFLIAASQLEGATITPEFAQSLANCAKDLKSVTEYLVTASLPSKGGAKN